MLIGYARVSKADGSQSLDLQRDALRAVGVDDDRPGLGSCVRVLRTGDVLVVWKLARLRPQPCSPSQHHAGICATTNPSCRSTSCAAGCLWKLR